MSRLIQLDRPQAEQIIGDLQREFKFFIVPKELPAIEAAAKVFDLGAIFVDGIPTSSEFMDYATTLGPVMLMPPAFRSPQRDPNLDVEWVGHETAHAADWWDDPVEFPAKYVKSTLYRTTAEMSGFTAGAEIRWLLTGELPSVADHEDRMRRGYGVDGRKVTLVGGLVEQLGTQLQNGTITHRVAKRVSRSLRAMGLRA